MIDDFFSKFLIYIMWAYLISWKLHWLWNIFTWSLKSILSSENFHEIYLELSANHHCTFITEKFIVSSPYAVILRGKNTLYYSWYRILLQLLQYVVSRRILLQNFVCLYFILNVTFVLSLKPGIIVDDHSMWKCSSFCWQQIFTDLSRMKERKKSKNMINIRGKVLDMYQCVKT
jgi:hypothetical protein